MVEASKMVRLKKTTNQKNLEDCALFSHRFVIILFLCIFQKQKILKFIHLQVVAGLAVSFLLLDVGASVSFPTIIISALTGRNNETNPNENISMTSGEASWFGMFSISFYF